MMDATLREKVKNIRIYTKRLMQSSLAGDYLSAFKGSGLEFNQIREYQNGDDIRSIDWNNSAKMNKMMIKQFIEERDRTVILAIDTSRSLHYSSSDEQKQEIVAKIAASLTFVADQNKDKVGALFFSDRIEKWLPPTRGKSHVGTIVQHIFSLKPHGHQTNMSTALRFLIQLKKRNAIVFFISDWIDDQSSYENLLKVARCQYEFVSIRLLDPIEKELPRVGLLDITDPETGLTTSIDLSSRSLQQKNHLLMERYLTQKKMFERYRIDLLDLMVNQPFINPMISFFHKRIRRQV